MKLTEKQKRFADYYIETLNAAESARRAGYSEKTADRIGHENLNKPEIKKYVEERMKQHETNRIATQEEVLQLLTQMARGEIKEEFAIGTGMGEQKITKKQVSAKDRIKAAELLGKRYAMWTDKQQVEGVMPVTIVNDLDD